MWSCTNSSGGSGYGLGADDCVETDNADTEGAGDDAGLGRDIGVERAVNGDGEVGAGDPMITITPGFVDSDRSFFC